MGNTGSLDVVQHIRGWPLRCIWYRVQLLVPGVCRAPTQWIGLAEEAAYRVS